MLSYRKFIPKSLINKIPHEDFGNILLHNYYDFDSKTFSSPLSQRVSFFIHATLKAVITGVTMVDRWLAQRQFRRTSRYYSKLETCKKNSRLNKIHKGKTAFVIGNGPSLANDNIDQLKNEITLVCNSYWRHPSADKWDPRYYLLADAGVFPGGLTKVDRPQEALYSDQEVIDAKMDFFHQLHKKTPRTEFIVPLQPILGPNRKFQAIPEDRTTFVPFHPFPIFQGIGDFPDFTHGFPWVQNVGQWGLLCAMAMGCNPIVMLGFDHDWLINYEEVKHFFPGPHFEKLPHIKRGKADFFLRSRMMWIIWRGYREIKKIADKNNIRIVNASGGILDVFPRMSWSGNPEHYTENGLSKLPT